MKYAVVFVKIIEVDGSNADEAEFLAEEIFDCEVHSSLDMDKVEAKEVKVSLKLKDRIITALMRLLKGEKK